MRRRVKKVIAQLFFIVTAKFVVYDFVFLFVSTYGLLENKYEVCAYYSAQIRYRHIIAAIFILEVILHQK